MTIATREDVDKLRSLIYQKQPVFAEIMREFGSETLYKYVQRLFEVSKQPYFSNRRQEIVAVIKSLVADRLDATLAEEVAVQLMNYPAVSTTDHHSWLQDPFWLNADLLQTMGVVEVNKPEVLRNTIILSFSSISLNNKDGYPKGLTFHDDKTGELHHVPLFLDKEKMRMVYGAPGIDLKNIYHAIDHVHKYEEIGVLDAQASSVFEEKILHNFSVETVFEKRGLCEQITRFNRAMGSRLFVGAKSGNIDPELVYIEIETVVAELFQKFHLSNQDSLLYRLLFDSKMHALAADKFKNLRGGYDKENEKGSYFFWGINDNHHRVALFLEDGFLVSSDNSISLPWEPGAVSAALKEKKLMPGMLLCYLVVSLYYGFTCFGGFCQVNDLTAIKNAWSEVLTQLGELDEAAAGRAVNTKTFLGDVVMVQMATRDQGAVPATSWDLLIYGLENRYDYYVEQAKVMTIEEAITPLLPAMYNVIK